MRVQTNNNVGRNYNPNFGQMTKVTYSGDFNPRNDSDARVMKRVIYNPAFREFTNKFDCEVDFYANGDGYLLQLSPAKNPPRPKTSFFDYFKKNDRKPKPVHNLPITFTVCHSSNGTKGFVREFEDISSRQMNEIFQKELRKKKNNLENNEYEELLRYMESEGIPLVDSNPPRFFPWDTIPW